jgi:hypothetical protein
MVYDVHDAGRRDRTVSSVSVAHDPICGLSSQAVGFACVYMCMYMHGPHAFVGQCMQEKVIVLILFIFRLFETERYLGCVCRTESVAISWMRVSH